MQNPHVLKKMFRSNEMQTNASNHRPVIPSDQQPLKVMETVFLTANKSFLVKIKKNSFFSVTPLLNFQSL